MSQSSFESSVAAPPATADQPTAQRASLPQPLQSTTASSTKTTTSRDPNLVDAIALAVTWISVVDRKKQHSSGGVFNSLQGAPPPSRSMARSSDSPSNDAQRASTTPSVEDSLKLDALARFPEHHSSSSSLQGAVDARDEPLRAAAATSFPEGVTLHGDPLQRDTQEAPLVSANNASDTRSNSRRSSLREDALDEYNEWLTGKVKTLSDADPQWTAGSSVKDVAAALSCAYLEMTKRGKFPIDSAKVDEVDDWSHDNAVRDIVTECLLLTNSCQVLCDNILKALWTNHQEFTGPLLYLCGVRESDLLFYLWGEQDSDILELTSRIALALRTPKLSPAPVEPSNTVWSSKFAMIFQRPSFPALNDKPVKFWSPSTSSELELRAMHIAQLFWPAVWRVAAELAGTKPDTGTAMDPLQVVTVTCSQRDAVLHGWAGQGFVCIATGNGTDYQRCVDVFNRDEDSISVLSQREIAVFRLALLIAHEWTHVTLRQMCGDETTTSADKLDTNAAKDFLDGVYKRDVVAREVESGCCMERFVFGFRPNFDLLFNTHNSDTVAAIVGALHRTPCCWAKLTHRVELSDRLAADVRRCIRNPDLFYLNKQPEEDGMSTGMSLCARTTQPESVTGAKLRRQQPPHTTEEIGHGTQLERRVTFSEPLVRDPLASRVENVTSTTTFGESPLPGFQRSKQHTVEDCSEN